MKILIAILQKGNMLKIATEARLLGTDPRLIDKNAYDDPNLKINKCAYNIYQKYIESNEIKGTQIVFCDVGTPNSDERFLFMTIQRDFINQFTSLVECLMDKYGVLIFLR